MMPPRARERERECVCVREREAKEREERKTTCDEPFKADDPTGREQDRSAWQVDPSEAATLLGAAMSGDRRETGGDMRETYGTQAGDRRRQAGDRRRQAGDRRRPVSVAGRTSRGGHALGKGAQEL